MKRICFLLLLIIGGLGVTQSTAAAAEPLFEDTDITQQVLSNNSPLVYIYSGNGVAEGVDAGAFLSAQAEADETDRTYQTNSWNWSATNQWVSAFAHVFVLWGWNPQETWAGRRDLRWYVNADLSHLSTNDYAMAFVRFNVEKWKGGRPGESYSTSNAVLYDTATYGALLPLGRATPLTGILAPSWPLMETAYKKGWDDQDCYYRNWYMSIPRVYGCSQTREVQFESIRPDPEQAGVGDPINAINGNVQLDATDIAIPCVGLPLVFSRSYNSVLDYTGPLGPRWTHAYNWRLSATSTVFNGATNAWLVVQTGEGRQFHFQSVGGAFLSPVDNGWRLSLAATNAYDLILPGGIAYTFSSNGVLASIRDSWQNQVTLVYSNSFPNQLLTRVEHSDGRHIQCHYSGDRLTRVDSPSTNLYVTFAYNAGGELTNATRYVAGSPQATQYAYDYDPSWSNHSLTQRVNAAGHVFSWEYATDGAGHITSKGIRTRLSTNLYDTALAHSSSNENRTAVTYLREDESLAYDYHYHPVLRRITDIRGPNCNPTNWANDGQDILRHFDDGGNATNTLHQDHGTGHWQQWLRSFDSAHNLTTESFGYCALPTNHWEYSWNTNWNVITGVTDPEGGKIGVEHTNGYPSRTRVYHTSNDSWDTLLGYTTNGLLSGVTNANGHWVNYHHDSLGNVTSVVPQIGPVSLASYTSLGHLQALHLPPYTFFADTSDPGSTNGVWLYRTTSNTVNELGWVSKTTHPHPVTGGTNGPSEYFHRDALGNVTNHVDIAGRSTLYTWLPTRKLSSVTQSLNGTNVSTSMTYDNQFNTLVIRDPLERTVEAYALDLQDRPVAVTNLEGQVMSISYGVGSFVRSITRFDGTTVDNSYNADGLISSVQYPDSTLGLTYLKNGLLSTATNALGSVSNSWSFANRLTSQTQVAPSGTVSYAQDPVGNVTSVTSVAGTTAYSLDEAERLTSLSVSGLSPQPSTFILSYNTNNGLISSMSCTNSGIGATYLFDAWDRVKNITWTNSVGETLRSFVYAYNSTGVISSVAREDGSSLAYRYDGLDRLTGETQIDAQGNTNLNVSLTYDLAGNRTSKTRDGVEVTYSLGDGNRLSGWSTTATNVSVTLDVSGYANEAIGTGERYGQLWVSNSLGRVTPAVQGESFYAFGMPSALGAQEIVAAICDLAGNTTFATSSVCMSVVTNASYGYSEAGCVTSMVYTGTAYSRNLGLLWNSQYQLTSASTNGTEVESYGYDPMGRRIYIAQGGVTNWLVYDGVQVLAEVNGSGQLQRSYTWGPGIDNLLAMTVGHGTATTNTYYALTDHLGTVHALADSSGSIVESYRFDAWGRVLGVFDSSGQPISESAIGNRYLWQGREYSWATGLYHFRARWYDPITGRWLSNDPIGISGGLNQYVFCANDPVNSVDPMGLCTGGDDSGLQGEDGDRRVVVKLGDWEPGIFGGLPPLTWRNLMVKNDEYDITEPTLLGKYVMRILGGNPPPGFKIGMVPAPPAGSWGTGQAATGTKVAEVLKGKLGSIKNAPLPKGSPGWDRVSEMTMGEVRRFAKQGVTGFKTILKLLTDGRFNK